MRVLHPLNLQPAFILPLQNEGSFRARFQQNNVKKARHRLVWNVDDTPLRRQKPGVFSARYAVEATGMMDGTGLDVLTDDLIEEFSEVERGLSG